jgi:hypothetical protein
VASTDTQFKPGESGNPAGRRKGSSLRAFLQAKYGGDAADLVGAVHGIIFDKTESGAFVNNSKARLAALKLALAYHSGSPDKYIEHAGADGQAIGSLNFIIRKREPKAPAAVEGAA